MRQIVGQVGRSQHFVGGIARGSHIPGRHDRFQVAVQRFGSHVLLRRDHAQPLI